jgi:hypothetical protein
MKEDPEQGNNLFEEYPEIVQEMDLLLKQHIQ